MFLLRPGAPNGTAAIEKIPGDREDSPATACTGTIVLHSHAHGGARPVWLGATGCTVASHSTGHTRVRLSALARRMIRNTAASGLGVEVTLSGAPAAGSGAEAGAGAGASPLSASIAVHGALG